MTDRGDWEPAVRASLFDPETNTEQNRKEHMINRYAFDANAAIETVVDQWKAWAAANGMETAVLGMSGGCDSYVCAALAARAFGKSNVMGVMMPNGRQHDIDDARTAIRQLGISSTTVDICDAFDTLLSEVEYMYHRPITERTRVNLAPRLRMCALYAIAQSTEGAFVTATGNLSERILGHTTMWGDMAGDYAPVAGFTKTEVRLMGLALGLIPQLVMKTPADGLSGKSDEETFGFKYDDFDKALRTGAWSEELYGKVAPRFRAAMFKQPALDAVASPDTDLRLAPPEKEG